MALSGYVQAFSGSNYVHTLFVNVVSQDVVANTSTVYYRYAVHSNRRLADGAWTFLHNTTFTAYINGNSFSATPNFDFRTSKDYDMLSGYVTLNNDSDGSLTLSLRVVGTAVPGSLYFGAVDSGTVDAFDAPTVPRASKMTVTPGSVVEGGTVTITFERAVNTFVHDVTWVSGSESGTIGTDVATSVTFTPDPDLLDGALRVPITITAQTQTAGGTNIGSPVSFDLIMLAMPEYPEIGQGTPYDLRFRRVDVESGKLVAKENIPFLEATITDAISASTTCTLTTATALYPTNLDEAVVVADVYDGAQWIDLGLLFVLTRTETDRTDDTETPKYTGMSYVDYLLSKNLVKDDYDWPVTNPGNIIHQYITIAKNRGWGTYVDRSFTQTLTSIGTPWQNTTDISASKNTPVSQLLDGFVSDILCEYRSHFDSVLGKAILDMYNPGYGFDWASVGANPIVNLSTAALFKVADKAPVRKDFSDKLTRVNVTGDETAVTRESAAAVKPIFGHLEGTVAATGVKDAAKLNQLGDAVLQVNATGTVERTFSYDLSSTQTPQAIYPYRTFRPGDWILAPGDLGPEKVRVSQVAITRDADGTTATITVGDLIPNGVAATARKLSQNGGGAIGGGTLRAPLPLNASIPAAPEVLDTVVAGYWDANGLPKASVEVTWTPVSQSLNGTDISVDQYEVWIRNEVGAPWNLAALSAIPSATITDLPVNADREVHIRARSVDGIYGPYSDEWPFITPEPETDIEGPDLADLYTDGVGNVYAIWGGTLDGDPAPARLAYVVAEVSTDGGTTYTTAGSPIVAAGPIVIPLAPNWGDYTVRLRGYDRLGYPGEASAPQDISISDPHLDPPTPLAPTNLQATAGAAWDATGYFPEAWIDLTWDPVTEDTDGNDIEVVGYDVLGLKQGEAVERFITSVQTNAARVFVGQGEEWDFRVRTSSNFGGVSAPSDAVHAVADATIDTADAPDAPTLEQYAGILRIKWSGNGMQPSIKYVYATISNGGAYTRAGMPLTGAGEVVVPGLAPDTYTAKIVMVDELGNTSTSAASDSIVLLPITGVTIQTSPLANTGIKMTDVALTAYDATGLPTFILDATTGEVWIAPYDAVFEFGATGVTAQTGTPTTGLAITSENSSFNTFFYPSGVQIRNDQTPLSWWEADSTDAGLVNFFSPRAAIGQRLRVGDFEFLKEAKTTGSRLVVRYKGA